MQTGYEFQFEVEASDGRDPVKKSTATVIVNILRDQLKPYFINTPYSSSIREDVANGTILQMTSFIILATDPDLRVSLNIEANNIYLFLTPNSRSVFRAGVSLNVHSFIHSFTKQTELKTNSI